MWEREREMDKCGTGIFDSEESLVAKGVVKVVVVAVASHVQKSKY